MGTRGAYGFVIDGTEKVTYNNFDSDAGCLGKNILEFIAKHSDKLAITAKKIELVEKNSKPTKVQKNKCKRFMNPSVSGKSDESWWCLLRETQGDLTPYVNTELTYMIDNREFLNDSLFCEYAYIINLDTDMLEYYIGFNKNPNAKGRYAKNKSDFECYYGVRLALEIPLRSINSDTVNKFVTKMTRLAKQ